MAEAHTQAIMRLLKMPVRICRLRRTVIQRWMCSVSDRDSHVNVLRVAYITVKVSVVCSDQVEASPVHPHKIRTECTIIIILC